jgi:putative transposase
MLAGGLIVRAIAAWQRRVARARHLAAPQTGAIIFVQRFGGLVNLNVHFHLLVPDGVFTPTDDDGLAFALLPAPTGTDLLAILDRVIRRIADETGDYGAAGDLDPCPDLFAQIQAGAAMTWRSPATATSDVVRGTDRLCAWSVTSPSRSLHAGVAIADHDREALERLARYGARPAFAHDRLTWTSDGRISKGEASTI